MISLKLSLLCVFIFSFALSEPNYYVIKSEQNDLYVIKLSNSANILADVTDKKAVGNETTAEILESAKDKEDDKKEEVTEKPKEVATNPENTVNETTAGLESTEGNSTDKAEGGPEAADYRITHAADIGAEGIQNYEEYSNDSGFNIPEDSQEDKDKEASTKATIAGEENIANSTTGNASVDQTGSTTDKEPGIDITSTAATVEPIEQTGVNQTELMNNLKDSINRTENILGKMIEESGVGTNNITGDATKNDLTDLDPFL